MWTRTLHGVKRAEVRGQGTLVTALHWDARRVQRVTLGIAEFKIHEGDRHVFKDRVKSPTSPKAQKGDGHGAELNLGFELFLNDEVRLGLLASVGFFRIDLNDTTEEYQRWGESKRHLVSSLTIPSLRLVGSYF